VASAIIIFWSLVMAAPGSAGPALPNDTHLRVLPAAVNLKLHAPVTVEVYVENVVDLYGADIQLQFPPALFQVRDANPSVPGVQITARSDLLVPRFIVSNEADNQAGIISYVVTQMAPQAPAQGSGALFSFVADTIQPGVGAFAIQQQTLATRDAVTIVVTAHNAYYQVLRAMYLPLIF
jgi:hypothetical protein